MTIIDQMREKIQMLEPAAYQKAMLMRFGLADGLTHSREEVCNRYSISKETAVQLEYKIMNEVFKMNE